MMEAIIRDVAVSDLVYVLFIYFGLAFFLSFFLSLFREPRHSDGRVTTWPLSRSLGEVTC